MLYVGAHVLACILGYLLGSYLVEKKLIVDFGIDFSTSLKVYIVLFFVHLFAVAGLDRVFPRLLTRVNEFLFVFLSHLVVITFFHFVCFSGCVA
jgi:hypothetical protein